MATRVRFKRCVMIGAQKLTEDGYSIIPVRGGTIVTYRKVLENGFAGEIEFSKYAGAMNSKAFQVTMRRWITDDKGMVVKTDVAMPLHGFLVIAGLKPTLDGIDVRRIEYIDEDELTSRATWVIKLVRTHALPILLNTSLAQDDLLDDFSRANQRNHQLSES